MVMCMSMAMAPTTPRASTVDAKNSTTVMAFGNFSPYGTGISRARASTGRQFKAVGDSLFARHLVNQFP